MDVRGSTGRLAATMIVGLAVALAAGAAAAGPAGAGSAGLERFYRQSVGWHGCQEDPTDAAGQALDEAGARCAEITVPLDYAHPDRRSITVAMSRVAATDPAHRLGPLIFNLGGPGTPVLDRVLDAAGAMGATGARFDLIGMDPRFVGRSTPMDCDWPSTWIPRSAGADRESFDRMVALSSDLAGRCAAKYGDLLRYASTANTARDMDVIRQVLGSPTLSYLGYSYGTYLGATYMQLFPGRSGRIVLDSAIDPADPGVHLHNTSAPAQQAALAQWAGWAAGRDATYHVGGSGPDVLARLDRLYQAAAGQPLRVGPYAVDDTVLPALLLDPLSDDSDFDNDQLARYLQTLTEASAGTPVTPDPDLDAALAGILTGAKSMFHSGQTATSCADQSVPRSPEFYWHDVQTRRAGDPLLGPLGRLTPCEFWPGGPIATTTIHNGVPALIVHAEGDINTTSALNQAMHRALTSSRMVTLDGARTHGVYLFRGDSCVDGAVNAYLNAGVLPGQDLDCTELPTPAQPARLSRASA